MDLETFTSDFCGIIFLSIVVILVVLVLYIYIQLNLFWPTRDHVWKPHGHYDDVMIDGVHLWSFQNYPGKDTILFCHGNAGNISHNKCIVEICELMQLNLLLFDYHGYGKSLHYPTAHGICNDGARAYLYLTQKLEISPDSIIIWSLSLGGCVGISIAEKFPCKALIVMSSFSSLPDVVQKKDASFFAHSFAPALTYIIDDIPSKERIKGVKCPVVIIHSMEDDLIPYHNGVKLFNACPHEESYEKGVGEKKPKKLFLTIQGPHSKPVLSLEAVRKMFTFCGVDVTGIEKLQPILTEISQRCPIDINDFV